jgi:hypothetical protein
LAATAAPAAKPKPRLSQSPACCHHRCDRRELYLLHGEGGEGSCQQTGAGSAEPGADEKDQDHHQQVGAGREAPADEMQLLIAGGIGKPGDVAGQDDRKGAVDVVGLAAHVAGVEGGAGSVEVVTGPGYRLQADSDHGQEAFIRVQVLSLIPVDAEQPQVGGDSDHDQQQDDGQCPPAAGSRIERR